MRNLDSLKGQFLVAMPGMADFRFERAVIYLCTHSVEGSMGFIINKLLDKPSIPDFFLQLNVVTRDEQRGLSRQWANSQLHSGGPVEPGRGFVLHSNDYASDSTMAIDENISLTATLEILRAIAIGRGPRHALMALGYSGWAAGQLEQEIAGNSWLTGNGDAAIIFDRDEDTKYERTLRGMGINPLQLSAQAGHA
jgi:putative transcriptional regulator